MLVPRLRRSDHVLAHSRRPSVQVHTATQCPHYRSYDLCQSSRQGFATLQATLSPARPSPAIVDLFRSDSVRFVQKRQHQLVALHLVRQRRLEHWLLEQRVVVVRVVWLLRVVRVIHLAGLPRAIVATGPTSAQRLLLRTDTSSLGLLCQASVVVLGQLSVRSAHWIAQSLTNSLTNTWW